MTKKAFIYFLLLIAGCCAMTAFGAPSTTDTIGTVATNMTSSFKGVGTLMIAIAYLAGIGFVLASIFKFKQHKDNPTQIPLGTPLAMLVIGIVLIFLPMIFGPVGNTIFGTQSGAQFGGFGGEGLAHIPGGDTGSATKK